MFSFNALDIKNKARDKDRYNQYTLFLVNFLMMFMLVNGHLHCIFLEGSSNSLDDVMLTFTFKESLLKI